MHLRSPGEVRRVEPLMGTTLSLAVRPPLVGGEVLDTFFEQLRVIDARFSPYRADSEVSRLARGDLAEADASPDLRHVLAACDHLAVVTDGAFDARAFGRQCGLAPLRHSGVPKSAGGIGNHLQGTHGNVMYVRDAKKIRQFDIVESGNIFHIRIDGFQVWGRCLKTG